MDSSDSERASELDSIGGPYMPLTLYTLDNPINTIVAPFINDSNMYNVKDSKEGDSFP